MIRLGGFLRRLLGPLLKIGLQLIKNLIKPLTKLVLIPLELTTTASAAGAGIHKKILGSGSYDPRAGGSGKTALIISNDEMEEITKIVKSLEDSDLLLKKLVKQFKMKLKDKKEDYYVIRSIRC